MGEERKNRSREGGEPDSRLLPAQFGQVLDITDTVVWEARLDDLSVEYLGPAEQVTGVSPDDATSLMELNTRMVHPEDQTTVAREFGALLEGEGAPVDTDRTVRADRARLQQLPENLVRNAVEHGTPDSPSEECEPADGTDSGLTVRVGSLSDGFTLEDDEVGFPVDRREAPFGDATGTGEHTGLGLRIVEQVVEAHNWVITATESDAGGARIEITGVEFA